MTLLGNLRENGTLESFNSKLRDELLHGEIFETLLDAKVLVERSRVSCNTIRPHGPLDNQATATEIHPQPFPLGES